ncbi:putative F-box protein At1g32420 [Durio zibethinus]|uniref:F-box protein At1g32420 n=1 Tax=Durio zibethinus TaxID=66656 RepID=A0A6P6AI87_DURZI|nr:putative F-box protein At1g32420 [Durio zibethinus]
MAMSNGDWPVDILTEILLKLPVKSILRFKCVAKTWCDLFQNPSFVSQHLSISKKNKRLLVYYHDDNNDNIVMRLFVYQTLVSYHDLHQQLPSHIADLYVLTFCVYNGLFCLCDHKNSRITLWNPATREFKILPECNQNIPPKVETYIHILGFGLDPLSNDYKVIYMRDYLDLEKNMAGPTHYAVYRMSTDSWRVLNEEDVQFFQDLSICYSSNNACVNGVYYWNVFKFVEHGPSFIDNKILAFYLGTEVFQLIESPCPESPGKLLPLHDDLISLWYIEMTDRDLRSNEVWVLNDDGHWTKLLKIEPHFVVQRTFGFWKNGKVFLESVSGQLMLYDLETEELSEELGIKVRGGGEDLLRVYTYEESLVAITSK